MANILLVQPPVRDFYLTSKRTVPYGLACIASALSVAGFSVEIIDSLASPKKRTIPLPSDMLYLREYYGLKDMSPFALFHQYQHFGYSFQEIGNLVKQSGAFLVGVSSLFTAYSGEALETAMAIKNAHPECKIVLGGGHPTAMPRRVMDCPAVDYVVRGEGEIALPLLARALQAGDMEALRSIPGLVCWRPDSSLQINEPASLDDLDAFPPPELGLVALEYYRRAPGASTAIVASRGCPLRCSYCSVGASSYLKYRRRSVDAVLREIEDAVTRHGVRFVDFEDENITSDRGWFLRLMAEMARRFSSYRLELRAMNGLLPTTLDDDLIQAMHGAGFKTLNLSLGSTNAEQQRKFRRPLLNDAFDRSLDAAERCGLQAVGYIIVGAPGQNAFDSVDDLLFLAERRTIAGVSVYYPVPGSADYIKCKSGGLLPRSLALLRSTVFPLSDATTRDQAVTLLRLGRVLNFMKALLDHRIDLPAPRKFQKGAKVRPKDRMAAGIDLLAWLMNDGVIRGATPHGDVFEHRTSLELTSRFLGGLSGIRVRGAA